MDEIMRPGFLGSRRYEKKWALSQLVHKPQSNMRLRFTPAALIWR
jgi:hypothetical protein